MCGFRVPALLLIAISVLIGVFAGPSYGFVVAFVFLVIAALSRARNSSTTSTGRPGVSRNGYKRVKTGSNIRGVKDLPPLPRKGGG